MKSSNGYLMILDCPVLASLEGVAVLEAEKPKDSEFIGQMLIPGTRSELTIQRDFNDISKAAMLAEPVLRALEKPLSVFEVEELGVAAPKRRKVHIVPTDDTWSEQEQPSVTFSN